jgi:hypothetical protein
MQQCSIDLKKGLIAPSCIASIELSLRRTLVLQQVYSAIILS